MEMPICHQNWSIKDSEVSTIHACHYTSCLLHHLHVKSKAQVQKPYHNLQAFMKPNPLLRKYKGFFNAGIILKGHYTYCLRPKMITMQTNHMHVDIPEKMRMMGLEWFYKSVYIRILFYFINDRTTSLERMHPFIIGYYFRNVMRRHTSTPAAMSHGLRRYSQYASTMPRATWHISTEAAPNRLTP